MGNTAKQCRLGLFQDSDFAGDLEDSKSTSGGTSCIFGSHTFVPISWMCKKQTSVSHSSTEFEIISLDMGLRLDGLLALELWDLIVSVFGNISHVSDGTGQPVNGKNKSYNKIDVVHDIDLVPSNVQSASREDWLFDRINLDPKIQIKHIDTKNQLADILTKGNFTRDEWNHLLTLFNISHFSSTSCIAAMAKRAQQESGEGRVTAKSRPMMNLTARTPSFVSSSASSNPGRTSYGYQDPEKPVLDDRAGQPVETSRSNYSQDYGPSWSSPVWKSGDGEHDRPGQPDQILGIHWETLTLIVKNIFSAGRRILQGTKRLFTIERRNPLQRISKERLILKISSWEVRQQNLSIKSETKCEFDRKECQAMQRIVPNIQ